LYLNYSKRFGFIQPTIIEKPNNNLGLIVVIPCHYEPNIEKCLNSILKCKLPPISVEVIVVINASENAEKNVIEQNKITAAHVRDFSERYSTTQFRFFLIEQNSLPHKLAGVGLARKIGMDEAASRFSAVKNTQGIILCYDADCTCKENYLVEAYHFFCEHSSCNAASVYFEHPLYGKEFNVEVYEAITAYELHLRYYRQALLFTGFPFANHTIGSCMAVRAGAYMLQGGMNKRKAGEDFYFLHKHIPLGNFGEINTTCVYPSPRSSNRVPFGTGRAVGEYLKKSSSYFTYNLNSFIDLQFFFLCVKAFNFSYKNFPATLKAFVTEQEWNEKINEFRKNSASDNVLLHRFWCWFDAFKILKFVHFTRDNFYADIPIKDASVALLHKKGIKTEMAEDIKYLLVKYRALDCFAEKVDK
jgi:hypothetical protein